MVHLGQQTGRKLGVETGISVHLKEKWASLNSVRRIEPGQTDSGFILPLSLSHWKTIGPMLTLVFFIEDEKH